MHDLRWMPIVVGANRGLAWSAMPDGPRHCREPSARAPAAARARRAPRGAASSPARSATRKGGAVKYMILVCVDESVEVTPEESLPTAWVRRWTAAACGGSAHGCGRSATPRRCACATARCCSSDGPFAETKEQIGGFDLHRLRRPRRGDRGRGEASRARGSARSR